MDNRFDNIVKEKPGEELLQMVYQFGEWDVEMLVAVEKELQIRNMLPEDISVRRQQMIDDEHQQLSKGTEASIAGQIFGWVGVLGLIGLIIGYNYAFSKVRSKYTGKKYYEYDEASRNNGAYMFYTCIATVILYFFYKIATLN